jgi:hypothetical protein
MILRESEEAEQEHRRLMVSLRDDLERDLYSHRLSQKEKNELESTLSQTESRRGQEASQKRILGMQKTHDLEMSNLRKDHDEQLKQIKAEIDADQAAEEERMRENYTPGIVVDEDIARVEAESERDERIQKTIRSLQADAIRFERGIKAEFDDECARIEDSAQAEYDALEGRRKGLQGRIKDLKSMRDTLENELESLLSRSAQCKPLHEYENDISVYEKGIATQRLRIRDAQMAHEASMQDSGRSIKDSIDEYKQKHEDTTLDMQDGEEAAKRDMSKLEEQHDLDLENLERRVKLDVSTKDDEINVLRDAVHTEKVRSKKLKKLLQQYDDEQRVTSPGRLL